MRKSCIALAAAAALALVLAACAGPDAPAATSPAATPGGTPLSLLEGNGVLASNGRLHPALMDALNEQERYQWNCALLSHPGN